MVQYIKVKNNRLWNSLISIRSYTVERAIKEGKGIEVTCNGVSKKINDPSIGKWGTEEYISKFDGKKYKLVDYKWI